MHQAYQKMLDFNKQNKELQDVYKNMQLWQIKNSSNCQGVFYPSSQL